MHGDADCIWGFGGESQTKTDPLEDLDVGRRVILKRILEK
jgi:hypothetical protein